MPNPEKENKQPSFDEELDKLLTQVKNGKITPEESLGKMADLVEKYKKPEVKISQIIKNILPTVRRSSRNDLYSGDHYSDKGSSCGGPGGCSRD